jgi:hypothetical protein
MKRESCTHQKVMGWNLLNHTSIRAIREIRGSIFALLSQLTSDFGLNAGGVARPMILCRSRIQKPISRGASGSVSMGHPPGAPFAKPDAQNRTRCAKSNKSCAKCSGFHPIFPFEYSPFPNRTALAGVIFISSKKHA